MSITLEDRIKHQIARGVTRSALTQVGYRVISSGMEDLFREVTILDKPQYKRFALAASIRHMPDFIIAEDNMTSQQAVEVMYRSDLCDLKFKPLINKLHAFGPFTFVLFFGSAADIGAPVDLSQHIRCCRLEPVPKTGSVKRGVAYLGSRLTSPVWKDLGSLSQQLLWDEMEPLESLFPKVKGIQPVQGAVEHLIQALV